VAVFCRLTALLHAGAACLVRGLVRLVSRGLAPFSWACRLGLLSVLFSTFGASIYRFGLTRLPVLAGINDQHIRTLNNAGLIASLQRLILLFLVLACAQAIASLLAFVRRSYSLLWLKVSGAGFAVLWGWLLVFVVRAPAILFQADPETFTKLDRNNVWVGGTWLWLPFALLTFLDRGCGALAQAASARPKNVWST